MSFDDIFDLTAGVYFYFFIILGWVILRQNNVFQTDRARPQLSIYSMQLKFNEAIIFLLFVIDDS